VNPRTHHHECAIEIRWRSLAYRPWRGIGAVLKIVRFEGFLEFIEQIQTSRAGAEARPD